MSFLRNVNKVLDHPSIYRVFNVLIGGESCRLEFINTYIRPVAGNSILDFGCGSGDILDYLKDIDYIGYDINHKCIHQAKKRFWGRGEFFFGSDFKDRLNGRQFDIVIASGLLHHLNDSEAYQTCSFFKDIMTTGSRLITLDGCHTSTNSRLIRWLLENDRGHFVRTRDEYVLITSSVFSSVRVILRDDLLR